jgi:3-oxoacyl-[acyl-carrier-protein] synthase-3
MRSGIEAVGQSTPTSRRGVSSIQLAAEAALLALERAQCSYDSIDLFINTGIYRDENICEPAIAALIQEKMGATTRDHPVFSFDLANGACGLLNAFQVVDSLLRAGSVRRALVVAADADPSPRHTLGYEFEPAGVAVVIGARKRGGFEAFHGETFPEHAGLFDATLRWQGATNVLQTLLGTGTHRLEVAQDDAFAEEAPRCAFVSAERFLLSHDLTFDDLDLVVAPGSPEDFSQRFADLADLPNERIVAPSGRLAEAHTAGPGLSIEAAIEQGRFGRAKRTLLLSVGAGITVATALYLN